MNQTVKRILFMAMAILLLITACSPAPAPTQDPAVIQEEINQAVEATLAAQNAQATEQQALIVPSNTPLPTQTEVVPPTPTPALPTATPFVIVPATNTVVSNASSGGGGGVVIQADYSCGVTNRKPADNTIFKPGADFDIKWTITNTGTKVIRKGTDIKFSDGTNLATITRIELPLLNPGDSTTVILDAKAPSKAGNYVMVWVVEGQLCYPYTVITVQK